MARKFRFVHTHPLLLGIYPSLAMLAANVGFTALSSIFHPLVFSILISLLIYLVVRAFVHQWEKASIISSILILVFFTFGHLYDLRKSARVLSIEIGRLRFLLPAILLIAALLILLVFKRDKKLEQWNWLLFFGSMALVIVTAIRLISFSASAAVSKPVQSQPGTNLPDNGSTFSGPKRDVYYIILDKYTRDDYVLEDYGLDTSGFIKQLEDLGFYVAKCSQPNYPGTALSMASSLNYEYLIDLAPDLINSNSAWVNLAPYIQNSRARQFFESQGYKFITAETPFEWVEVKDADIFIKPQKVGGALELTSFDTLFLKSTLLRPLFGISLPVNFKKVVTFERAHYERILYTLSQAKRIPEIPGPKFVYLHLIVPHAPYIFTPEGDFRVTEDEKVGYVDNIRFIDNQIVPVVKEIIEKSAVPPVIILQGDHGYDGDNMYAILNAYYLPEGGSANLYPTITPVNSFRVVLDEYFGTDLGLLQDTTYTWKWEDVYDFGIFENTCTRK